MDNITLGYDDNLGLPNDLAEVIGCATKPYHQLDKMLADFEKENLTMIFIPAGTLPYIKNYEIVAQALFGIHHNKTLKTCFTSKRNISFEEIPQLTIGRVNQYCTTSFWAPLIYLMRLLPVNTLLTFENANSFQDMLHKTATGKIDCAMVWDIILKQNPQDAAKVHEFFSKQDLPTPVLISKEKLDTTISKKITNFVSQDQKAFFSGFQAADLELINQFIVDMKKATEYFTIKEITSASESI